MADKSVIQNIEARVRQLIGEHRRLSGICAELTAERDALGKQHAPRARVNRLMREVDKCIALLERPDVEPDRENE